MTAAAIPVAREVAPDGGAQHLAPTRLAPRAAGRAPAGPAPDARRTMGRPVASPRAAGWRRYARRPDDRGPTARRRPATRSDGTCATGDGAGLSAKAELDERLARGGLAADGRRLLRATSGGDRGRTQSTCLARGDSLAALRRRVQPLALPTPAARRALGMDSGVRDHPRLPRARPACAAAGRGSARSVDRVRTSTAAADFQPDPPGRAASRASTWRPARGGQRAGSCCRREPCRTGGAGR